LKKSNENFTYLPKIPKLLRKISSLNGIQKIDKKVFIELCFKSKWFRRRLQTRIDDNANK
jgi:hypothetical protein